MRVRLSAKARTDLFEIGDWIERDSPKRAESFVDEIYDACQRLAQSPRAYRLLPGHEDSGIRRKPFGNYLIFYLAGDGIVEIVRVLHGARDYEALLFPEGD